MSFSENSIDVQGKKRLRDMTTLGDFYKQEQEILPLAGPAGEPSASNTESAVANAVVVGLEGVDMSNTDVAKFAGQVGEFVTSEEFWDDMSCEIGQPTPYESEDEFVARCKSVMRSLLGKRLG